MRFWMGYCVRHSVGSGIDCADGRLPSRTAEPRLSANQIFTVREMIEENRHIDLPLSLDVLKNETTKTTYSL